MPPLVVLSVFIEELATELGMWCTSCSLSTGARVWFVTTIGTRTTLRESRICTMCGGREIEE